MSNVRVFKLPRKTLSEDPRRVSQQVRLRLAPKAVVEPEAPDALATWEPGFSRQVALDHLESLGAAMPERPETDPDLPDDVTRLGSEQLGTLHAQFVAYVEWLEGETALAEIDADEAEAYLEHVDAEIRLRKAGTVNDKTAKTKNDLRYITTEQAMLTAKARAKLLKARVRGYERCGNALSREMTRRVPTA